MVWWCDVSHFTFKEMAKVDKLILLVALIDRLVTLAIETATVRFLNQP